MKIFFEKITLEAYIEEFLEKKQEIDFGVISAGTAEKMFGRISEASTESLPTRKNLLMNLRVSVMKTLLENIFSDFF